VRVPAEDRRQVETVIDGHAYRARDGFFEMPDPHARVHLKAGNLPSPNLARVSRGRVGYRCTSCGFGSFVKTCSRCGGTCEKET
jgi:hypothetical protein